jgi:hypothetical protein
MKNYNYTRIGCLFILIGTVVFWFVIFYITYDFWIKYINAILEV